jgi:hypothetical protein
LTDGFEPQTTPYFNLRPARYIYSKKGGWIDMVHFLFYAGKAYEYKEQKEWANQELKKWTFFFTTNEYQYDIAKRANMNPAGEALQDGYHQEAWDALFAKHSAYSYEDLPSDRFGADFGANYFDKNSKLTFGEQLENYLINILNAVEPSQAPNFDILPVGEPTETPSRQNKTANPVFVENNP